MINARTLYRICSSGLLVFPAIFGNMLAPRNSMWELLVSIMFLWGMVIAIYGAFCGIQMVRGKLKLGCPICNTTSPVLGGNRDGLFIDCPHCGELRLNNSLFRLKVSKLSEETTEEEDEAPEQRWAILSAPTRSPRFFAIIFAPVIGSIIASSIIHKFLWFYLLIPGFWCYGVGGMLIDAVSRGRLSDNHGIAFRKKEPVRFWGKFAIWLLAYIFAASFPIGYGIQEHNKEVAKKSAP